ncbi:MAG TPA: hypothetical protein VFZ40_05585 [Pyrinomonadaceae bacterium]
MAKSNDPNGKKHQDKSANSDRKNNDVKPAPRVREQGFFPKSRLVALASMVAKVRGGLLRETSAPRSVMSAIRELNELSQLASRIQAGHAGAERLFEERISGYRMGGGGGGRGGGGERMRALIGAMDGLSGMAGRGWPCGEPIAVAADVIKTAFSLDVRDGDKGITRTREAGAFVVGRMRTVARFESQVWRQGRGEAENVFGGRGDGRRAGGVGGDPVGPGEGRGGGGFGGPVGGDPVDEGSEPIFPPGPEPDPGPGGEPPAVDPNMCEQIAELCMELYAESASGLISDPNIDLMATVEPNCLCHTYDAQQIFVGRPAAGREFPDPFPADLRLIFRGDDITANIISTTPQEIRFRIPPNSHTGYVYLRGLFPVEQYGNVQNLERLCGISMPDFPHLPGGALGIAPPCLISIIFPPVFESLTAGGQPGPDVVVESCHGVDICWRVHLSDQAPNLPIPPCGRIEVTVRNAAANVVHRGGPSECYRAEGRDDQTFTVEASSFAGAVECGHAGPERMTLERVQRVTLTRNDPPTEELIAGNNGSFFAEISCPAPAAGMQVRLVSSDRNALQVPANAVIPNGQTRTQVDFTSTAGHVGDVEIRANAVGHEEGRLEYDLVRSPAEICHSLEAAAEPWTNTEQPRANWSIIDQDETFLGFVPSPRQFRPTNQFEVARAIQRAETDGQTIRALGSGWSFSEAMLPQSTAIQDPVERIVATAARLAALSPNTTEQQDQELASNFASHFGYAVDTSRLDRNLQTILPDILRDGVNPADLFYVEAGMTINFLNTLLDSQTPPVALKTMGGASGQSIAGAISTGTHGGDFERPPLGDNVRALYIVGAGGVHHWVEPAQHFTDPEKLRRTYPCLDGHIHYDDDMFHSVLVSIGAMGVIYAVVLDVVPQYSLLQWNRWSTWEQLHADEAGNDFAGLFDGSWSGMNNFLQNQFRGAHGPNRFVQVVVNPFPFDDGSHHCYVTNRVQLPLRAPGGVQPISGLGALKDQIISAIKDDILHNVRIGVGWDLHNADLDGEDLEVLETLVRICTDHGYWRGLQIATEIVMNNSLPQTDHRGPQIDLGFKVMAPGGTTRQFPPLGGTAIEPSFSFFPLVPAANEPGLRVRVPDVVTYINSLLELYDRAIFGIPDWVPFDGHPFSNAREAAHVLGLIPGVLEPPMYPAGWISLRVTGRTSALLGMQRFNPTGFVEVSLLGRPNGYELIRRTERLARDMGGALHWGQSCGMMGFIDLEFNYGNNRIDTWKATQRQLGGPTFTNRFMERLGLDSP